MGGRLPRISAVECGAVCDRWFALINGRRSAFCLLWVVAVRMRKRILVGLAASAPLVIRLVGNTGCDKSSRSSLVIKKEQRGDLRAIVFGDTTHKQMLPDARLEVIDGPATGQLATFDAASGIYR